MGKGKQSGRKVLGFAQNILLLAVQARLANPDMAGLRLHLNKYPVRVRIYPGDVARYAGDGVGHSSGSLAFGGRPRGAPIHVNYYYRFNRNYNPARQRETAPYSESASSASGAPGAVAQASSTSVTIRRPAPSNWQTISPCSSI